MGDCCTSYKIIFTDLNMPLMSGIEATGIIRKKIMQREIPGTIIVALSAKELDFEEDVCFCKRNGFDSYLTKPVTRKDLGKVLARYNII